MQSGKFKRKTSKRAKKEAGLGSSARKQLEEEMKSFQSTIVTLDRDDAQLAEEKAIVEAYARGMNRRAREQYISELNFIACRKNALRELPKPYKLNALRRDLAPFPLEQRLISDTPPVPGYTFDDGSRE